MTPWNHYAFDAENRPIVVPREGPEFVASLWKRVAQTDVFYFPTWVTRGRLVNVSTVFLGIDHRWMGDGPPILFESFVSGGPLDHHCWRSCTWEEAEAMHEHVVRLVRWGFIVRMWLRGRRIH